MFQEPEAASADAVGRTDRGRARRVQGDQAGREQGPQEVDGFVRTSGARTGGLAAGRDV